MVVCNLIALCSKKTTRLVARSILVCSVAGSCSSASPTLNCDQIVEFEREVFIAQCGFEQNKDCTEPLSAAHREQWRQTLSRVRQQTDGHDGIELACTPQLATRLGRFTTLRGFRSEAIDLTSISNGVAKRIPTIVPAPAERWEQRNMPFNSIDISRAKVSQIGEMIEVSGRLVIRTPVQHSNEFSLPSLSLLGD